MTTLRQAAEAVMEQLKHGWVSESDPVAQDLKAALAEPETTCRRAICQRGPDGYCAPCHERMYP